MERQQRIHSRIVLAVLSKLFARTKEFRASAWRLALIVTTWAFLSSCSSVSYLVQAGRGQLSIINHARPIEEVLKDPRTSRRLAALLTEVKPIKKYAESAGLKPTSNYETYVKLDRPFANYVVSASQPLRFEPKYWSFPIVGSFSYLGWFDRSSAEEHAAALRLENWDVDVRGARAFSTLGWFQDPILSSMISDDEDAFGDLVNVVLHESVHATLYVPGQSTFNESLASFMADRMTPDCIRALKGQDAPEVRSYLENEKYGRSRQQKFQETYWELVALYDLKISDTEKLERKEKIFSRLKKEFSIQRDINNATLIQYKTYGTGEKEFAALFEASGTDWKRFLKTLSTLKTESFPRPQMDEFGPVISALKPTS